ncbi:MAG TPA: DNA polymerase IV, partial [Ruminococcaceae bacterium]|nr:DNA polymerase IV [Oscillospiraceae bacterium]
MDRTILHVDFNYFYANVECLYHPELRNRPVAVGGDEAQRHDVVLAKTPEAKRFGVCTGESLSLARKKCPGLIVVPAHHGLYMHFSKLAHKIYERYADRIESFGLDECWIDVTENIRQTDGQNLADELRWVIQKELGITASVGVSWNKVFAKLGSDLKKPNATTIISRKTYKKKIWPLPVSALLYVGESTTQRLHNYGMNTIGELAMTPSDLLKKNLGKRGADLWTFANGMDSSPVAFFDRPKKIKSVGNSVTTYQHIATISE